MSEDLYVVAVMTSKPDRADELRELLIPTTEAFRQEDGCLAYALHEGIKRPGRFVTYEVWRDEAALAAHMVSPTLRAAGPTLKELTETEMEQHLLKTLLQL